MSTFSNKKFLIGIAVAFLVPLSFYMAFRIKAKDRIVMPPYYRAEHVETRTVDGRQQHDTIFHQLTDLQLVNQLGQPVSLNSDLQGKILVIDFFFTDCTSICPRLTSNMRLLQRAFRKTAMKSNDTLVQFISITVNPERDSVPVLRAYADSYGANHDRWWFLTGDKQTIYDFARNELGLSTGPGDGGAEDFVHTEKFVLVDRDRFIRGYYNGLDSADLRGCANDIGWLAIEKKRNKK